MAFCNSCGNDNAVQSIDLEDAHGVVLDTVPVCMSCYWAYLITGTIRLGPLEPGDPDDPPF